MIDKEACQKFRTSLCFQSIIGRVEGGSGTPNKPDAYVKKMYENIPSCTCLLGKKIGWEECFKWEVTPGLNVLLELVVYKSKEAKVVFCFIL